MRTVIASKALYLDHALVEDKGIIGKVLWNFNDVFLCTAGKGVLTGAEYEREIDIGTRVLYAGRHIINTGELFAEVVKRTKEQRNRIVQEYL